MIRGRTRRLAVLLAVLATGGGGCVLRTLEVKSKPAGAVVYLDDQAVGKTPLTLPFDYYGTRAIRVAKPGHHPHQGEVELAAPWYEWFPLDFFSEILWPGVIRDRHHYAVELRPVASGPVNEAATAEFVARAERRLLESRIEGYTKQIGMALDAIAGRLEAAPGPAVRRTLEARRDRLRAALAALPAAGSLAGLGRWEAAHRAAVRDE